MLFSLFSLSSAVKLIRGTSEEEGRLDRTCCTMDIYSIDFVFVGHRYRAASSKGPNNKYSVETKTPLRACGLTKSMSVSEDGFITLKIFTDTRLEHITIC